MKRLFSNKVKLMLLILLTIVLLTGCIPGDESYIDRPANFLSGIWHGWIAPITLIGSLFKENQRIYEVLNVGFWYDFGFYIAIISGFGGLSLSRKKKK